MAELRRPAKKRTALVLTAVLVAAGGGVAYAYWTASGSGTGEATTGTAVAFTIASDPAVGDLSPGSAGQTVDFTVTNPGTGSQLLEAVTVTTADADGVAWVPAGACEAADYTATISTPVPPGEVPAGGSVEGVATITLANTGVNQDDCQGQAVPLYFEVSAAPIP